MRVLRGLLVGLLAAGVSLAVAPDAHAAKSRRASAKACKTLTSLQKDLDSIDPSDSDAFDRETLQEIGDAFHKAVKKAPRQVKSALKTLGDFYEDLADADSAIEAAQTYGENGERFSAAITKFSKFYRDACSSSTSS